MTDSFVGDVVIVLWVNVLCFCLADFGALAHLALWHHMATQIWVSIGLGDGLLSDGTKQFPEPMLTFYLVSCCGIWEQINSQCLTYL